MSDDDFYALEEDILINEKNPQREEPKIKTLWLTRGLLTFVAIACVAFIIYLDRDSFKFGGGEVTPDKEKKGLYNTIKTNWEAKRKQVEEAVEAKINEGKEEVQVQETFAQVQEEQKKAEKKPIESYGAFKNYGGYVTASRNEGISKSTPGGREAPAGRDMSYMKDIMSGLKGKEEKEPTFSEQLTVEPLEKVMARQDYNPDYTIYKGSGIQAILKTHMSTDLSGMITATTTHDVWSSNRKTLLIPRQSFVTGRYQSGLSQGKALVFTVWENIRTECNSHIALNSPGISPMGLPGQSVVIDHHFVERFGASMMLSLTNAVVSGAVGYATGSTQATNDIQSNFNKSSEIALQDSIKIKPTGTAKAGQTIAIMVARDLDFSNIYRNGDPCEL